MRILWCSNPPFATSAYGQQTALFVPFIQKLDGFEVAAIAANASLAQATIDWHGIRVLPMHTDQGLNDVLPHHFREVQADAVVSLYDTQTYRPEVYSKLPVAMWAPLDTLPIPDDVMRGLSGSRWQWSLTGSQYHVMREIGFNPDFVPHGIDTDVFKPVDRTQARQWLSEEMKTDLSKRRIVVTVAQNRSKPSRKNFNDMFSAFRLFSMRFPDAFLYLHTDFNNPIGENLEHIVKRLNLGDKVGFASQYKIAAGLYSDNDLNNIYNAADVYFCSSYSEGFCIPLIEAQAAGCPVIMPDMPTINENLKVGIRIATDPILALHSRDGGYWWRIKPTEAASALEGVLLADNPEAIREKAHNEVQIYNAANVFEQHMKPALLRMKAEINQPLVVNRTKITIVTPWLNHPEYIAGYERAVANADEVFIVDNGSTPENARLLLEMCERLRGVYYRSEDNLGFSKANNVGLFNATGEIVLFLNNDIQALDPVWLNRVRSDVTENAICGISQGQKQLGAMPLPYIEGWCIAALRSTWLDLNGWSEDYPQKAYWDDNDICFRAQRKGMELKLCQWNLQHLGGGTSRDMSSEFVRMISENAAYFAQVVQREFEQEGVKMVVTPEHVQGLINQALGINEDIQEPAAD